MRSPFPPLASSSGGGSATRNGLPWCCASSERMGIMLTLAGIIWVVGLMAFLGAGSASNLMRHPTSHTSHGHRASLVPRGAPEAPAAVPSDSGVAASAGVAQPSGHARGFGFSKLASLQKGIKDELHHLLHHSHFEQPTDRYGRGRKGDKEAGTTATPPTQTPTAPDSATSPLPPSSSPSPSAPLVIPNPSSRPGFINPAIVILTYKRRGYLLRTLDSLMVCPGLDDFALYVSQDMGPDVPDLTDLRAKYSAAGLHLLHHPRVALMTPDQGATAYLAQHYKWVLDKLFLGKGVGGKTHSHVVVMEDDLVVSPDFLSLFRETAPLLDTDPTLMCVSSWNDIGMARFVADTRRLMRTDYFPGLGWMTNRAIWEELSPKFPLDQWDHFMRLDTTYRGRDCLIPEVARNRNIGEEGTNMGDNFHAKYLAPMAVAKEPVSFVLTPQEQRQQLQLQQGQEPGPDVASVSITPGLDHLRGPAYEQALIARLHRATLLGHFSSPHVVQHLRNALASTPQARLPSTHPLPGSSVDLGEDEWLLLYTREGGVYRSIASLFGLISAPRSTHRGVSTLRIGGHVLWMVDVKRVPEGFIPDSLRFKRDPSMRPVVARQNEPCSHTCVRVGEEERAAAAMSSPEVDPSSAIDIDGSLPPELECSVSHFQFLNECSALMAAFPSGCSKGCVGGVSGHDIPNHVDNPQKPEMFGYCLTTEGDTTCEAKHWSASRLCACVEKKQ